MYAYYPPFDDKLKIGPVGPPGIGFRLTKDGNFDLENKILKQCGDPVDDQDATTKRFTLDELEKNFRNLMELINSNKDNINQSFLNFVNETGEKIKELYESCLYLQNGFFDARDKRIGNVKDPKEPKNVVNKRYLEKNTIVLKNDIFDADTKPISNVSDPINDQDASTKRFVLNEIENFNKNFNLFVKGTTDKLIALDDRLYELNNNIIEHYLFSEDKKVFDAKNRRIGNVDDPISDKDVVNKKYVDRVLYVSSNGYSENYRVNFNKVNNYYFDEDLKLKFNMTMILTFFLEMEEFSKSVHAEFLLSNEVVKAVYEHGRTIQEPGNKSWNCSVVLEGKTGDVLSVRNAIDPESMGGVKHYLEIKVFPS